MNFKLIDYSEHYFTLLVREPIPASRGGKFVQIRHGGKEYIVLSPAGLSMYHGDIVERFCKLNDLDGHWNAGRTVDPSWTIVGGGKWVIDSEKKTLELGSSSQAYGFFDSEGLDDRIQAQGSMKGYEVRILADFFRIGQQTISSSYRV